MASFLQTQNCLNYSLQINSCAVGKTGMLLGYLMVGLQCLSDTRLIFVYKSKHFSSEDATMIARNSVIMS